MSLSINTNVGALTALSVLNQTNNALEITQNRVSSGLRVSTAKDDQEQKGSFFCSLQERAVCFGWG